MWIICLQNDTPPPRWYLKLPTHISTQWKLKYVLLLIMTSKFEYQRTLHWSLLKEFYLVSILVQAFKVLTWGLKKKCYLKFYCGKLVTVIPPPPRLPPKNSTTRHLGKLVFGSSNLTKINFSRSFQRETHF